VVLAPVPPNRDPKAWIIDDATKAKRDAMLGQIPAKGELLPSQSPGPASVNSGSTASGNAVLPGLVPSNSIAAVIGAPRVQLIPAGSGKLFGTTAVIPPSVQVTLPVSQGRQLTSGALSLGKDAVTSPIESLLHPSQIPDTEPQTAQFFSSNAPNATQNYRSEAIAEENQRKLVMSMCIDLKGNLWVGTEGGGVQRLNPKAPRFQEWTQYTVKDGLGDDNGYAVACDLHGRIWVGHLNHGVSVFDGKKWQLYEPVGGVSRPDSLSGPIGERIFCITVCPTNGDVWIATNAGLTRYRDTSDEWSYYTRAEGLPSDEADGIAFDKEANIYVSTQCDGLIMAQSSDDYKHWRQALGPNQMPTVANGTGLPSNLLNDVTVADDGTVYAATDSGLAWSVDCGSSWKFLRGKDWADRIRGRNGGPPHDWTSTTAEALLAEDWCDCLASVGKDLLVGFRTGGVEARSPNTAATTIRAPQSDMVTALAVMSNGTTLVGTYGDGISSYPSPASFAAVRHTSTDDNANVSLPSGAKPPELEDLNQMLAAMALVPSKNPIDSSKVIGIEDDWRTEGDWLGRYGRYWAVICAVNSPSDYLWGAGLQPVSYSAKVGDSHSLNDSLRYWVGSLYTSDPRVLEMPPVYMDSRLARGLTKPDMNRRQAEWDDHGEAYPVSHEGPDIYCSIKIPNGQFILSAYEMNNDGHAGRERSRDYSFEIKSQFDTRNGTTSDFSALPTIATARVSNFWNGVYKRFLVQGPAEITIRINRHYSENAMVSGFMLDLPDERPAPYFMTADEWDVADMAARNSRDLMLAEWQENPSNRLKHFAACTTSADAERKTSQSLESLRLWNPQWWAYNDRKVSTLLARWCEVNIPTDAGPDQKKWEGSAFYRSGLYPQWEMIQIAAGQVTARQIEKSLKWDQKIPAYSGRGYATVAQYLKAIKQ
jgi:sugar lactone lactonase YvrE